MRHYLLSLLIISAALKISAQSISISEINYNADNFLDPKDWVEVHNYGATLVDISGWKLRDVTPVNVYTIPDGTTLQPGSFLVIAQDLDTFHLVFPTVSNAIGDFVWGLDNGTDVVRLQNASGTTITSVSYVDTLPWPNGCNGLGPTLQLINEGGDENDPANWIAGCIFGTPGTPYVPCNYHPDIDEINYHAEPSFNTGDWVEIWNNSGTDLDLSGWVMRDRDNSHTFTIPGGTVLSPDGRIVLSDSLVSFSAHYPSITNVIGDYMFGYSGNGDAIRLYDATGKLRYSIRYNDDIPWPTDPDGNGFTLELHTFGDNPNIAANWIAGCLHGSPGTAFIFPCPDAIETINGEILSTDPNPFTGQIDISFSVSDAHPVLMISDITGRKIRSLQPFHDGDIYRTVWNGNDASGNPAPAGIYFVTVATEKGISGGMKIIKAK